MHGDIGLTSNRTQTQREHSNLFQNVLLMALDQCKSVQ